MTWYFVLENLYVYHFSKERLHISLRGLYTFNQDET
jgi:hypothetical protein